VELFTNDLLKCQDIPDKNYLLVKKKLVNWTENSRFIYVRYTSHENATETIAEAYIGVVETFDNFHALLNRHATI